MLDNRDKKWLDDDARAAISTLLQKAQEEITAIVAAQPIEGKVKLQKVTIAVARGCLADELAEWVKIKLGKIDKAK